MLVFDMVIGKSSSILPNMAAQSIDHSTNKTAVDVGDWPWGYINGCLFSPLHRQAVRTSHCNQVNITNMKLSFALFLVIAVACLFAQSYAEEEVGGAKRLAKII